MIRVVETGKNPTMRYLSRTHRIAVSWLHEVFQQPDLSLVYEKSAQMCADIYTKAFTDPVKWKTVCWLINVVNPTELETLLNEIANNNTVPNSQNPTMQSGGILGGNDCNSHSEKGKGMVW